MNGVLVHELISISPVRHIKMSSRNTFVFLTSLQIIARRMAALTLCENFWSGCMIMDGEHAGVSSQHLLIFVVASMLALTPFRKR
jgi:hypothetical protein